MLINKILAAEGYIFVKNADIQYIKMLSDLGSIPIFVYIKDNRRIICQGVSINKIEDALIRWFEDKNKRTNSGFITKNNYNLFNFDRCYISEIKQILSQILIYNNNSAYLTALPSYVETIYFFNN